MRRCDVMGVKWPRISTGDLAAFDPLGWGYRRLPRARHIDKRHDIAMDHLRERPVLPPWATVAGERGSHG